MINTLPSSPYETKFHSHLILFDARESLGAICTVVRSPERIPYVNCESINNNGGIFRYHEVSQHLLPRRILGESECFHSVN